MNFKNVITTLQNALPFLRKNRKSKTPPLETLEAVAEENTAWWGHFLVVAEQSRYSKIGPIILCIDHYQDEWKLAIRQEHANTENAVGNARNSIRVLGSFLPQDEIKLNPILADRNLQAKLACPLYIPPNGTLTLFASSPAWVRIEIGHPPLLMDEIPTEILGDTWYGENTLTGDLCYAGTSLVSPRLEDIFQDTIHITSPVVLQNFSRERVYVKELQIPLPFLSVFSDSQNRLWTEEIILSFENDALPKTHITQGPPQYLVGPTFLTPARIPIKASFKSIFSRGRNHS